MKELKFKSYASIKNYEESSDVDGRGVIKFSGWATRLTNPMTGEVEPDRDGELVDYENVALNAKVLLAQHDSDRFIGTVRMEKRENGIWFEAMAHEYLDSKVYYGLKEGILDSVSIGFMVDDWEFAEVNGEEVLKLLSNEIYELSVVSIPSNRHATVQSNIDQVKMFKKDNKCVGLSCSVKSLKEMNPDCGCNVDELRKESKSKSEKGAITYGRAHPDGTPKADIEASWDGPAEVAKADVEDLMEMCAYVEDGREDVKDGYKFPHHRADDKAVVFQALVAAMSRLNQADVSEEDRRGIYNHIARHYRDDFDKEPPEYKSKASDDMTDFPRSGDNEKISLRNSNYPQFDYEYAVNIKENYSDIWQEGGNIRGNDAFQYWTKARNGEETEGVLDWIKEREAWAARHYDNNRLAGVVALMKWGVIGSIGISEMKKVINEAKKEKGIKEMENSKTKNTETESTTEEPKKEEPAVEETPKEETPKEEPKQDVPAKEESTVEEPKKEEPEQEPVKEEPAKAESVPEKEPESVNPVEDIIGKLSTFSLDSVQSEEELEAIEQAVDTMRNRLDSFYDEVSEMAAQELNKDEN